MNDQTNIILAVNGALQVAMMEFFTEDFTEVGGFNFERRQDRAGWKTVKVANWRRLQTIDAVGPNEPEETFGKFGFRSGDATMLTSGRPGVDFHAGFSKKHAGDKSESNKDIFMAHCRNATGNQKLTWAYISESLHELSRIFGGRYTQEGGEVKILVRKTEEKSKPVINDNITATAAGTVIKRRVEPTQTEGQESDGRKFILTTSPSGATTKRYVASTNPLELPDEPSEVSEQPTQNIFSGASSPFAIGAGLIDE